MNNYLTVKAVCKRQGITRGYFTKLRKKYNIPVYKFGKRGVRFDPDDIKAFFSEFKRTQIRVR